MSAISSLVTWARSFWAPPGEVRAEIWALGGRHLGRVMEGARIEAAAPGLSPERAIILAAVLRTYPGSAAEKQAQSSADQDIRPR